MTKALYYKILNYQPCNIKILNDNFEIVTLDSPNDDTDKVLKDIEIAFAPLGYKFNNDKIDKMPKLKVIASNTTGEPHIDREYAESKKIKVISLKNEQEFLKKANITSTAEHTWGLLLAVLRKTAWAHQSVLKGNWNRYNFGGKAMLSKMTIGIAGFGRLGQFIAQYAKSFMMKEILFYDPLVKTEFKYYSKIDSLEKLVSKSDIITIHIPYSEETVNIFDKKLFSKFKKGSFLINSSRAEMVDENAMLEALESDILSGAAVDVFDGEFEKDREEILKKSRLLRYAKKHDNLLITPHISGSTLDAWELTERRVIDIILNYF